ncbi:MAG: UxaA family hydrolase, partial [Actinomycetota bacterium]
MSTADRTTAGFEEVARLPAPGDNAAIAVRTLDAGTRVAFEGSVFTIAHTVLEGHRFAVRRIGEGEELLSWELPFGAATKEIQPGEYLCNAKILRVLKERRVGFDLPPEPNFRDDPLLPYALDETGFRPGEQVSLLSERRSFMGYARGAGRGVGTRNYVVILGVNSRTGSYAKALERRLDGLADACENVSGIVAVAHTEGGEERAPNNLELLLRTLAGFMVHPNVGAVLAVDDGYGAVTNAALRRYAVEHGYPLDDVPHEFMTLRGSFEASLRRGEEIVRGWLGRVDEARRTGQPLSGLKIALQCGGSDAFSGISANPLAGWVAKEVIRHGGSANLAETDELIGAERYVLRNVRDLETARRFLDTVERFKERVSWHGHTAEGNPSGGNNYRGLYNIAIKSIGAARKKDPEVRLDRVIGYAERMDEPGFYFMDSPGNDLESIAGQVASGANMIFFTTGNGSITNFPFVPTIKFVTTTGRYELLSKDMDVNAGAYLDGEPMEELGRKTFGLTLRAASGERTVGERAGHSQVSIWRDWRQTGPTNLARIRNAPEPDGEPLPVRARSARGDLAFEAVRTEGGYAADRLALIMPTSLCAAQISLRIAERLNGRGLGGGKVSRFVALPHTEGCGVSGGSAEDLYARTVLGYLSHPLVGIALLLEHGCEKTHNDYFRARLAERGLDPQRFGWASIQLDGGIERVVRRVEGWFEERLEEMGEMEAEPVGPGHLRLGLHAAGPVSDAAARGMAGLTLAVVGTGGTVVVPERTALLSSPAYLDAVLGETPARPTLAYGQAAQRPGLHVMRAPTDHWLETATGLGATGVEVMLAHVAERPLQAHRMVPLLQTSSNPATLEDCGEDLDVALEGDPSG